jgi:transcriptional regulator with XRE-family HTH domain
VCAVSTHKTILTNEKETLTMAGKISFGTHLRKARKEQKLRVRDVAAQMDISDSAIYCWETDRKRPSDANLTALCKVLKLPVRGDVPGVC